MCFTAMGWILRVDGALDDVSLLILAWPNFITFSQCQYLAEMLHYWILLK